MPMLVYCRHVKPVTAGKGFTLLEMLVVLLITALVAGVVFPALTQLAGSVQRSLDRDEVRMIMNGLAQEVRAGGSAVLLTDLPASAPSITAAELVQAGVSMSAIRPVFVSAAGFCPFGGELKVMLHEREYNAVIEAPLCRFEWRQP
jgi:prepilin-type N-terminal cleavage/methylation domain-containing protein